MNKPLLIVAVILFVIAVLATSWPWFVLAAAAAAGSVAVDFYGKNNED